LLEQLDLGVYNAWVEPSITPEVVASGWLGYPGATKEQLRQLEARLGITLPPSYRNFLRASNGFRQPGQFVPRLYSTKEISWLHEYDSDFVEMWVNGRRGLEADDAWFPDDDDFDPVEYHLPNCLRISANETIGPRFYILNPDVVTPEGEWEAVSFAHTDFYRYPSFADLMLEERGAFLESRCGAKANFSRNSFHLD
jgi:hypothetical protein